jgi:hypothetical protein
MKKFVVSMFAALALLAVSSVAMADDDQHPYRPVVTLPDPHPFRIGVGLDVGVPSGAALEVTLHPKADWVRVSAALTYNYLSFGPRASVQLDPLALLPKLPIALYADIQGGISPMANIPGHSDLPSVGYDYLNLYGVLRLGTARGFHWNIAVGPSYIHATTGNFQSVLNNNGTSGLTVGNPEISGWLVPTFSTGFEIPITL